MSKISNYKLLRAANADELSREVMHYIGLGWQPLGGASPAAREYETVYTQAVVKYALDFPATGSSIPHFPV